MKVLEHNDYIKGILDGDTIILSRAITLLESTRSDHQVLAREILEELLPHTGGSKRIGITGVPGVGKSTFIEAVGENLIGENKKLAVLAVDPSSSLSKGSILGDKTRMEKLTGNPRVYIRPTAAGGSLGGVSRRTRETIMLCEAAGYDYVLVETVGVGQSEIAVHSMVDCFVLLLLAGAGDELQGIKRGIMEMADIIAINKAYEDDELKPKARLSMQEIKNALHYYPQKEFSWLTKVKAIDSLARQGLESLLKSFNSFFEHQDLKGFFKARRKEQDLFWFHETIKQRLLSNFYTNSEVDNKITALEAEIIAGKTSSFNAADQLFQNGSEPFKGSEPS
ncbi:MAG: LAO/AO transport system kinase [Chitinophagales bacterium]|jgi:LAO/AO transport system kinase